MKFDYLIVGAGYTGAIVAERLASQCDKKVLLIDKRDHIGGNAYDEVTGPGLLYHKYGPHIFHTNAPKIVEYLSKFTEWRPYEHRVMGLIDGRLAPIPFNLTSLKILFPAIEAEKLTHLLVEAYGLGANVPILKMRTNEHQGVRDLADYIYKNVFRGYTVKQWGLEPEQLSPSVTARVPVSVSFDDRYFQDTFQKMPREGYTEMFRRMLDHPNIAVQLNADFRQVRNLNNFDKVIYTGAIDEFFDYELGELPYRSLRFDLRVYDVPRYLPTGSVNYPTSQDFTRITEMSHLTGEWKKSTAVMIEYPQAHVPGKTIPYYPIPRDENTNLHNEYVSFAKREAPNVVFAGRLGDYKYYNMDQAAGRALSLFERLME